ncbi:MAG TPA: hypothetical protein VJ742_12820 [Nitrososphaera sp.]|nr:hypothetical protein [Nitrososphaera sp.]
MADKDTLIELAEARILEDYKERMGEPQWLHKQEAKRAATSIVEAIWPTLEPLFAIEDAIQERIADGTDTVAIPIEQMRVDVARVAVGLLERQRSIDDGV